MTNDLCSLSNGNNSRPVYLGNVGLFNTFELTKPPFKHLKPTTWRPICIITFPIHPWQSDQLCLSNTFYRKYKYDRTLGEDAPAWTLR